MKQLISWEKIIGKIPKQIIKYAFGIDKELTEKTR
jgi:hypothetical protein